MTSSFNHHFLEAAEAAGGLALASGSPGPPEPSVPKLSHVSLPQCAFGLDVKWDSQREKSYATEPAGSMALSCLEKFSPFSYKNRSFCEVCVFNTTRLGPSFQDSQDQKYRSFPPKRDVLFYEVTVLEIMGHCYSSAALYQICIRCYRDM